MPENPCIHPDTCDDCGRRILLALPRQPGQPLVLCEDCWSELGDIHDAVHL